MSPPFVHVAWPTATNDFPIVQTRSTYSLDEGQEENPAITLPTGITSGDLLLMFANTPDSNSGTVPVAPTGWTQLYATPFDTKAINHCACYYRVADGNEGATVTMAVEWTRLSVVCLRISRRQGNPEAGTFAKANSVSPNPPSLTPSWGSDTTLWLAVAHSSAATTVTYPASYANGTTVFTGAGNNFHARTSTAERTLEATSEDPGEFTLGQAQPWVATTVAVRGAAA